MLNSYKVESSSEVNGKTVVTLDRNCSSEHLKMKYVVVAGKKIKYSLTHSEDMIILDEVISKITGKELSFA